MNVRAIQQRIRASDSYAKTHHILINDKMKQTALLLYEMLSIREGIFEFCHDQNFLTRSQVDEIIAKTELEEIR